MITRDNNLVRIEGNWDAAVNEGVLCKVGRFKPMEEELRSRRHPHGSQRTATLKAATWEEAFAAAADECKTLAGKTRKIALPP